MVSTAVMSSGPAVVIPALMIPAVMTAAVMNRAVMTDCVVASAMVAVAVAATVASLGLGHADRQSHDCHDQRCRPDRPHE
jgi:hypothetical protein